MKNGWQIKELGAVSAINYGYTESASSEPVGPRFLRITDIQDERVDWENVPYCKIESADIPKYRLASGDIVFARTGATTGKSFLVDDPPNAVFASYLIRLRLLDKNLLPEFVSLFFQTGGYWQSIKDGSSGSAQGGFNATKLGALTIPIPPLAEQQRIVGLLDEAFAGIATAKANAEKNLQNARALFESHLQSVFTQRGKGWVGKKLSEVCAITSTLVDPRKKEFLDLTHVGAGNIESQTGVFVELKTAREENLISGKFLFDSSMVLYSKIRPYLMKVARPDFDGLCSADMYPLAPLPGEITRDFLFHLLLSKDFTDYAIQGSARAGMPKVNRKHLFEFKVWLPDVKKQKELTDNLDKLHEETQHLESLYERKLAALEALKKSLLHQAFTGKLTKEPASQPITAPLLELLPPIPSFQNLTPINLHAGILAIDYQAYELAGRQWHFQHVVAEKLSHMTEAIVGLDLGRKPVQDHNGPNDFPHLIKVEHRARMANYFTFQDGQKGKVFVKGRGFDSLVAKTRAALCELNQKVDEVIKLMLPMDMQQAEIFATTYAAWNNLLMDGLKPTDEQIVWAARENWHADKLKLERERFFKAIDWIRKKNICPQGKGKRVLPKIT
jgi:type I restriction enzyme S subunit